MPEYPSPIERPIYPYYSSKYRVMNDADTLAPGDVISFSAGDRPSGDCDFRTIRPGNDRLAQVLQRMPQLQEAFLRVPLVVNCYPASLGNFASAVTCDTYQRPSIFHRALLLAASRQMTAVVLGQPLLVAELLLQHVSRQLALPDPLIVCVGGYFCPCSLESFLRRLLDRKGVVHYFLHAYGVAEVDFAIFVGERNSGSQPLFHHVANHVEVRMESTGLQLGRSPVSVHGWHETGDFAEAQSEGLSIIPGKRLHPEARDVLESWSDGDWCRRTGYIASDCGKTRFQLRTCAQVVSNSPEEVEYYEYLRLFGRSFPEKPDWSFAN